jgi:hypothetical protein
VQSDVDNKLLNSFNTLDLCQDDSVCWNSVYLMLLCCYKLCQYINRFICQLSNHGAGDDKLNYSLLTNTITEEEWDNVKDLIDFLEAPYQMTKRLEGNNSSNGFGSLWQTLPNLQALWVHFEKAKAQPHSKYMVSAIALGAGKLNTYFTKFVHKPGFSSYTLATALNPVLCLNWFQTQWKHYLN